MRLRHLLDYLGLGLDHAHLAPGLLSQEACAGPVLDYHPLHLFDARRHKEWRLLHRTGQRQRARGGFSNALGRRTVIPAWLVWTVAPGRKLLRRESIRSTGG